MTLETVAIGLGALVAGFILGTIQSALDHKRAVKLLELQRDSWRSFAAGVQQFLEAIQTRK